MRNGLIFMLIISLLLGVFPVVSIGETVYDKKLEEVILSVKGLLDISDKYDNFNSQINSNGGKTYFYLNWSDSQNKLENISVNTDSEGNIISFNKYNPVFIEPDTKLPKFTKDEAQKLAFEYIQKIDPKLSKEIKIEENQSPINSWDQEYNFRYVRFVNGIPFPDNNININVNKFTGEINNYYTNWERDITLTIPENIISLEEAKKAYQDKIGLDLIYKSSQRLFKMIDTNDETKYYLAYSTLNNNKAIDAVSGEVINLGYYGAMVENEKSMDAAGTRENAVITPEERTEIDKLSGIKEIEEIEKIAREILDIKDDYTLQNKNLHSSWKNPGEFQWSLYFIKNIDENRKSTLDITLDARTADLLSFYRFSEFNPEAEAAITKEQALKLSNDYINKIQPERAKQVELIIDNQMKDNQLSYYFRFIRKIDDIYVESDSISVGVDAVNKIISSYSFDWFNGTLPPKGNVIDFDKAYEVLYKEIGYEMRYVTIFDYEKPEGENKDIKLVYAVNPSKPIIIDANSGELLDYTGSPYNENKILEYTDIDNSYAKDKIITLAEYGVGFNSSEFMPKEFIKQKEFIYLLWESINSYRTETEEDIEKIYTELSNTKIVREGEKNLERLVTKEEAVKFVIRAMNYGKIAELSNIYTDLFDDSSEITPTLKGYMNIAFGLKIINGDGSGLIRPRNEIKREDAVSIIYNYMFN